MDLDFLLFIFGLFECKCSITQKKDIDFFYFTLR